MEIEVSVPLLLQKLCDLLAHERKIYLRSTVLVRMTETKSVLESICKRIEGLERGHASPDLAKLRNDDFLSKLNEIENVIDMFIVKTELRRRNSFIKIMPPLIYLASLQDQIHLNNKMDKFTTYAKGRLSQEEIVESTTATDVHGTYAKGRLSEEEIMESTTATNLHTTYAKGRLSEEEITESTTATDLHATYAKGRLSEQEIIESTTTTDLHTTYAKGCISGEEITESTTATDLHTTHAKGNLTKEEIMEPTNATNLRAQLLRSRAFNFRAPRDPDFIGLEDKIAELFEKLLTPKDQESDNVITVTGNAGSGKTALTKKIYNDSHVRRLFNHRAWVNVSEDFKAREILLNILRQLRWESKYENLPDDDLELRLKSFLKEKWCLVVVDIVRTPFDMEKLSVVLKCIGGWSRLILTTPNKNVACAANPQRNQIMVRSLTDEESWALFLRKAQIAEDSSKHPALINLQKEILEKCGGSPLEIIILGRLLSKKDSNEWYKVIKQLRNMDLNKSSTMIKAEIQQLSIRESSSVTEPAVQQLSSTDVRESSSATEPAVQENIFTLSYHDLSPRMKFCFLYFGLFPRSYEIPVRRLFHLWLAEGLVIPLPEEQKAPEDLAEEYIKQLLSRNLIEVAGVRLDGSPKRCLMPGCIWDVFNPMAVRLGRFYDIRTTRESEDSPKIRRLVEYAYSKNCSSSNSFIKNCSSLDIQNLRCYVSFDNMPRKLPIQEVRICLKMIVIKRCFGLLIVLDLENVYKPMLSETLGKMPQLKYLGLRRTFIDSLPTSVGNLPYLETLDVRHANIFALPKSIWKAKNLRHLYLNEIHIDMSVKKPNSQSLTKLQTLWGLFIVNESLVKNCLSKLTGLRKLKLTCTSESEVAISNWISQLSNLESLKLRSIDSFDLPSTLNLKTMEALHKLCDLYLLGELPRAISKPQFPRNLKILTLSASQLEEDPMQILGQLPELNVLRLLRDSYTGKRMTCLDKGFPKLHVLKLWMLYGLEEWVVQNGAMPCLRELEIRCCNQLKQPDGLQLMTALERVILTNMPNGFAENVERVMPYANVEKVCFHLLL